MYLAHPFIILRITFLHFLTMFLEPVKVILHGTSSPHCGGSDRFCFAIMDTCIVPPLSINKDDTQEIVLVGDQQFCARNEKLP